VGKKQKKQEDEFVLFDVTYEDGSKSSRRRINVTGLDSDEIESFAMTEIMTQDRKIMDMGGKNRGQVKEIVKSA
jgi:hypothetical protein